jgi:glycosyltransferase involved in cell wall biosynthesis
MSTRVSVVTAVYNGESYISRAIPSILSQRYSDFEFIIVDDGSTDGTPSLIRDLARRDRRVRVLSPGRIGFSNALNLGIQEAQGEYIARQDFDDISYPDRVSLQVQFLDDHSECALVGGYYIVADENRREDYVRRPPLQHHDIVRQMSRRIPFAHTIVMFRRAAWEQAGGYPVVDDIEDLRLWIRFAQLHWELANIPVVLGKHWVHPQSFWHRGYRYRQRQRTLRRVQWQAIRELKLPLWMGIYPLGRMVYPFMPRQLKRFVRRELAQSEERDLTPNESHRVDL